MLHEKNSKQFLPNLPPSQYYFIAVRIKLIYVIYIKEGFAITLNEHCKKILTSGY